MENPPAPAPANPDNNDENTDNTPAGPNAPAPHQPAPAQPPGPAPPIQPALHQPAPANPAGPTVPVPNPQPVPNQHAPQIIHQQVLNWSHFKSEFAGRPEEDVKAHLLCTNDWMVTHNIQEDVKGQRFCLTLVDKARLWYESLIPIANGWPALQEHFRRQYSKIGNMREQLFHAWWYFHYDENAETVDAYVNRIRQAAAMLNYRELQILEVFKNTIPNRLFWILFPIDNLRVAVETVKRVLTKDKIDRQMSGQSSTTPFMKVSSDSHYSSMKSSKKGVTFDAMETIEKNSNSIDKLTLLVSKMNMKIDKREAPYKPQMYQGRPRGQSRKRQNNYQSRNRSFSRDRYQNRNRGITIETIIGISQETTMGMMVEETTTDQMIGKTITSLMIGETVTDKMIGETIIDETVEETIIEIGQIMEGTLNGDIEMEVRVGRIQEIIIVTIQEKDLSKVEIGVEIGVETDKCNQEQECYLMKEKTGQGLDPTLG